MLMRTNSTINKKDEHLLHERAIKRPDEKVSKSKGIAQQQKQIQIKTPRQLSKLL